MKRRLNVPEKQIKKKKIIITKKKRKKVTIREKE